MGGSTWTESSPEERSPGVWPITHITGDSIRDVSESPPGLLPIFRSQNQLRLLGFVFAHAGSRFSIAELERRTGIPQQTISREVDRLAEAGLVSVRASGRMRMVEANESSPYFPELHGLLLKAAGPAVMLAERLEQVSGVHEAYVFGSWARRYHGELGPPPADVDVVVVGDADPDEVEAACVDAGERLGLEVNPVVLSDEEWRDTGSGFIRGLRKGPLVGLRTGRK
jgi:predicted nucleotidyltransferase